MNEMNNQREFVSTIFYFCLALATLIPAAGSAAEEKMSAAEIRELLPSNTLSGINEKRIRVQVYHDPSGTMEGMKRRQGVHFYSGNWTITDEGQYCQQWNGWRAKASGCFHIYRLGENKFRLKSVTDMYESRFTVREGDPEGLKVN
jgi:hypothetical protein